MKEIQIRHTITVNKEAEKDFEKIFQDSSDEEVSL